MNSKVMNSYSKNSLKQGAMDSSYSTYFRASANAYDIYERQTLPSFSEMYFEFCVVSYITERCQK